MPSRMNETPSFLIITGMHRSGTSLTASLLQRAGLELGANLNQGASDNPHGYFEDMDVVKFHQEMLQARGQTIFGAHSFDATPTDRELAQAHTLAASFYQVGVRGWKDPRACFFLAVWAQVLPTASYLFVYRSPLEVLLSLMRRKNWNMAGLLEGLEAWTWHNERILDFYGRHPDRCFLCSIDTVTAQPEVFLNALTRKLELPLAFDSAAFAETYHKNELRHIALDARVLDALAVIHPEALRIYAELERRADIPNVEASTRIAAALESRATELERPRRRAALLELCAELEPDTTEAFYTLPAPSVLQESNKYVTSLRETLDATRERLQESIEYTQSLENALVQALLQASTSKTYATSLADTLEQTRAQRADAEQYARSLESTLEQTREYLKISETYARSLEQEIEKIRAPKSKAK